MAFASGFCIMTVEMLGARILSPYFGGSLSVWGSIITIFMLALALGYLWGGKLSARKPSAITFAGFFIGAAVFSIPIIVFSDAIMEPIFMALEDPRYGSLFAAIFLFFIPTSILGMISPYAVRLMVQNEAHSGQMAGLLYFISTLGSAAGTSGPVFISCSGSRSIRFYGVLSLPSCWLAWWYLRRIIMGRIRCERIPRRPIVRKIAVFMSAISAIIGSLLAGVVAAETIHEERSKYRDITVTEVGNRRCLLFNVHRGDRNQTCVLINYKQRLVFDYTRMSFAGLLLNDRPNSILVIGLGGGSIPLTFADLFPDARIDVVEIDEAVVSVAEEFFFFEETENMTVYVDDGRPFIKRAGIRREKYDYIVLDAFSGDYIPEHMLTREFLDEVRNIMRPESVLVANTFSTSRLYDHESVTYQRAFGEFFNFKLPTTGNRIIITQLEPLPPRSQLVEKAQSFAGRLRNTASPSSSTPRGCPPGSIGT